MAILNGPASSLISEVPVSDRRVAGAAPQVGRPVADAADNAEDVAMRFEAAFLAEMLRHAGLGEVEGAMGGGAGEAQFAPMFVDAVAERIARSKPLGIADMVAARIRAAEAET
ncbi:MAG: rod-binding protein [Pseudomonadota bacterium]